MSVIPPSVVYEDTVIMMDVGATAVEGLVAADITVDYTQPDGTQGSKTGAGLTGFTELGDGHYRFTFGAAEIGANPGTFTYAAKSPGNAVQYNGRAQIVVGGIAPREACAIISLRGNEFHAVLFLQTNGIADTSGTEGRVTVFNEDGSVAIAQQTDAAPDAQGMFDISFGPPHALLKDRNYTCKVEIDSPTGDIVSYQGFSTI